MTGARRIRLVLAVVVLACSACTSFEHPVVAESGPTLDPALVGTWIGENDEGDSIQIHIRAEGKAGFADCLSTDKDGKVEAFGITLVTAQLERRSYASAQPVEDNQHKVWMLYAYEVAGPDRLLVRNANIDFWKRAVKDKIVSGEITKNIGSDSVSVTASGEELREAVLGYGAVLFEDEVAFELRRKTG